MKRMKKCAPDFGKKNLEPANKYSSSDGEMLIISVRKNISNIKTEKRTGEEIQIPGRLKSATARWVMTQSRGLSSPFFKNLNKSREKNEWQKPKAQKGDCYSFCDEINHILPWWSGLFFSIFSRTKRTWSSGYTTNFVQTDLSSESSVKTYPRNKNTLFLCEEWDKSSIHIIRERTAKSQQRQFGGNSNLSIQGWSIAV